MRLFALAVDRFRPTFLPSGSSIGLIALMWLSSNALSEESPVEKQADQTVRSTESSSDGLSREEIERQKRAEAARNFKKEQEQGRGNAPVSAVSKPKRKASAPRPVSGDATPHDYAGFIDDASINLSMTVFKGKVGGDFYFLRAPHTLYTFSGANPKEGVLTFTIDIAGTPFAKATLKKDPRIKNSILWDGTLQTADNRTLRLFLNRPLKPATAPDWPATMEEFDRLKGFESYEGSIVDGRGLKAKAFFKLRFTGVKCDGFYYQIYPSGRTSFIFRLEGQNPKGLLTLREFDDEGMSAELYLKKTLTGNVVSWAGEMTNHRFNQLVKKVEFQRTLKP